MRVSYVTGSKHARDSSARCIPFGNNVAYFIGLHPWLEDFRVRLMSDSQEKSVNCNVITLFIGFSHTFYYVHAFYTVISIQSYCIMFEQYFDIRVVHYPFLHDFRSTEERLAYYQINLAGQTCQVDGFFAGSVSTSHYGYYFFTVEETVAGSAGANTHAGIFLFVFQSQIFGCGTGRDDNGICCNFFFFIYDEAIRSLA